MKKLNEFLDENFNQTLLWTEVPNAKPIVVVGGSTKEELTSNIKRLHEQLKLNKKIAPRLISKKNVTSYLNTILKLKECIDEVIVEGRKVYDPFVKTVYDFQDDYLSIKAKKIRKQRLDTKLFAAKSPINFIFSIFKNESTFKFKTGAHTKIKEEIINQFKSLKLEELSEVEKSRLQNMIAAASKEYRKKFKHK